MPQRELSPEKSLATVLKTTKKSVAAGAVVGGAKQGSDSKRQQQAKKDWEQKEASNYAANGNEYNRAYGACLEGCGYAVK